MAAILDWGAHSMLNCRDGRMSTVKGEARGTEVLEGFKLYLYLVSVLCMCFIYCRGHPFCRMVNVLIK